MKKLIATFLLLLAACVSFTGCDILGSDEMLEETTRTSDFDISKLHSSDVFKLYILLEQDMSYEDAAAIMGKTPVYDTGNSYDWEWNSGNIDEYIHIQFKDNKLNYKKYSRDGEIYDGLLDVDYDIWKSVEEGMDIETFLEKCGKYVTMYSHSSSYFSDSAPMISVDYYTVNALTWCTFGFVDNIINSKYISYQVDYSSSHHENIISAAAYAQIEDAISNETYMSYEDVCTLFGGKGLLTTTYMFYRKNGITNVESYVWWNSEDIYDLFSLKFTNGVLDSFSY